MNTLLTAGNYVFDLSDALARMGATDWLPEDGRDAEAELLKKDGSVCVKEGTVAVYWTKETVRALLASSPRAVYRALICLYNRQTADEQETEDTRHLNGRGFNAR